MTHAADRAAQSEPWGTEGQAPDMALAGAVGFEDVRAAAARLAGRVSRTPLIEHAVLNGLVGGRALLKCENLQPIGAFKIRGGMHAMLRLGERDRARGVITFSSGNHAQAMAWAAAELCIKTVVVMPVDAPRVKLERTRASLERAPAGSRVVVFDPCEAKREELGRRLSEEEGLTLIPPYDHPDVIAGQGTAALELFERAGSEGAASEGSGVDELYVCVGGGGLLSGCAIAASGAAPGCRVIGVEPALADDAARSFRDRVLRTVSNPRTIADGARTPYTGRYTLPMILRHVHEMVTVTEEEIASAMRLAFDRLRLVVEPAGALGLAGLLKRPGGLGGRTAGVIISGGNVDLAELPGLLAMANRAW